MSLTYHKSFLFKETLWNHYSNLIVYSFVINTVTIFNKWKFVLLHAMEVAIAQNCLASIDKHKQFQFVFKFCVFVARLTMYSS